MTNDIRASYYKWLRDLVKLPEWYSLLGEHLHYTEFRVILGSDYNCAEDGRNVRYNFGYQNDISYDLIDACLGGYNPSVLEVMVALAIRMEREYLAVADLGDRTSVWFWDMLKSLGLDDQKNENYDDEYVTDILNNFMLRAYASNGKGGLFTFDNPDWDARTLGIWSQCLWKMNNYLSNK